MKTGAIVPSTVRPNFARRRRGFTQADVTKAIRAAQAANLEIAAVRIAGDGTILIIPGTPSPVSPCEVNPWDA